MANVKGPVMAGDPISILRSILARKVDEWACRQENLPELMFVWHPVVEILDLQTGEQCLEAKTAVIAKREPPFDTAEPLEVFYAHLTQAAPSIIKRPPVGVLCQ